MYYNISVELRYKRHKYSIDTKHYEVLYGVVRELGAFSREQVEEILSVIQRDLEDQADVASWLEGSRMVRIYVKADTLMEILNILNVEVNFPIENTYDYVLEIKRR